MIAMDGMVVGGYCFAGNGLGAHRFVEGTRVQRVKVGQEKMTLNPLILNQPLLSFKFKLKISW